VANFNSDNVTTFSINQTTGALTEVGTAVLAGDTPRSIVILGAFQ
jgi:6-phosphogluconolactonase (cycloisomerase 2 family)